jgi:small subunit ribosomal protein S5
MAEKKEDPKKEEVEKKTEEKQAEPKKEEEKKEGAAKKEAEKEDKKAGEKVPEKTEEKSEQEPSPKVEKEVAKDIPAREKRGRRGRERSRGEPLSEWKPKTSLGMKVQSGEIKDIKDILDNGLKILEPQIADTLLPSLETDLLLIGQAKGKFGGGKRRIFKQTQKKTREGNKPKFATAAIAGNKDGYIGLGYGKSKETVPAREKAIRNAKVNILKIRRGCGDWQCGCKEPHSIPFTVEGKCGSVIVRLIPAPKGKGLIIEEECGKILKLAGIKDVWSKTFGHTATKTNLIYACVDALAKLTSTKISATQMEKCGIVEGSAPKKDEKSE